MVGTATAIFVSELCMNGDHWERTLQFVSESLSGQNGINFIYIFLTKMVFVLFLTIFCCRQLRVLSVKFISCGNKTAHLSC